VYLYNVTIFILLSWFAGYLNKEETEKRLTPASPGTFIVRFSGSRVDQGWFVIAVKTREEVVQIEIEVLFKGIQDSSKYSELWIMEFLY